MRRFITSMLVLGLLSFTTVGLVGCGDESKTETQTTVKAPGGTTTTTDEHKVKSTGENPPPNPQGETAK